MEQIALGGHVTPQTADNALRPAWPIGPDRGMSGRQLMSMAIFGSWRAFLERLPCPCRSAIGRDCAYRCKTTMRQPCLAGASIAELCRISGEGFVPAVGFTQMQERDIVFPVSLPSTGLK